jgi:hypothetical protein
MINKSPISIAERRQRRKILDDQIHKSSQHQEITTITSIPT